MSPLVSSEEKCAALKRSGALVSHCIACVSAGSSSQRAMSSSSWRNVMTAWCHAPGWLACSLKQAALPLIRDVRSVISGSKEGGDAVCNELVSMRSSNANEDGSRMSTGVNIWHCEDEYCRRALAWAGRYSTRLAAGRHVAWGFETARLWQSAASPDRAARARADDKTPEISPLPAPENR